MIVELRQYTLHPGRRDELIELFHREFVAPQESLGMRILGTYRDLSDADRFVWLRAFHDMTARKAGLTSFYGGPIWKQHREAANATMIDSDNVLLLRPAASSFELPPAGNFLVAAIRYFDAAPTAREIDEVVERTGASKTACLITEYTENDYPALPVREGEHAVVCFRSFPDATSCEAFAQQGITNEALILSPT